MINKVNCITEKGDAVIILDVDGMPHLDATFFVGPKLYKIIEVRNAGDDKEPKYECIVKKIGKDQA